MDYWNRADFSNKSRETQEVRPPPEPTCSDGIKNNGEQMVDCGGPNCEACYEEPTEPIDDRIYSWVFLEIEKIGSSL